MAARAGEGEGVEVQSWKAKLGAEYADVVDEARNVVEVGRLRFIRRILG